MKKQSTRIVYFAVSLFAILNCETLVAVRAENMEYVLGGHVVYALYSVCVALGAACFFIAQRFLHGTRMEKGVAFGIYPAALLALALLAVAKNGSVFLGSTIALFLLAGWNTGMVSLQLYLLYQETRRVGRVLAAASALGISGHLLLVTFAGTALSSLLTGAGMAAICALCALYLHALRKRTAWLPQAEKGDERHAAFPLFFFTGVAIAALSFLIGISDGIAAGQAASFVTEKAFFNPMIFYLPGQAIACLLLDVREGQYLHLAIPMCAVALVPITLFLQAPEEFYLHAGINYFIGGFFLVYIMTAMISIAHKAMHPLLLVCLPGMLYPFFCGIGGLLSLQIAQNMNLMAILSGYALLLLLLMSALALYAQYRQKALAEKQRAPSFTQGQSLDIKEVAGRYGLTRREKEILPYLLSPMTANEIAQSTHISVNTLKTHTRNILEKIGASSRKELRQRLL